METITLKEAVKQATIFMFAVIAVVSVNVAIFCGLHACFESIGTFIFSIFVCWEFVVFMYLAGSTK